VSDAERAELAAAKIARAQRIGPPAWTFPRYAVWQAAAGRERRDLMRQRCGLVRS
jgi:hypothetical protein